jgi:hypothetical protein
MDEIIIRAACPEDAADATAVATQPQVVWGTLQLPAQTVAGWQAHFAHAYCEFSVRG